MAHSHNHGSQTSYYVEQIVTIATCGALAGVCILLFLNRESLYGMLNGNQHLRVLFGGIGLLILVLIRATHVWIAAGKSKANAVNHDHTHAHDHDHVHCDHEHDHAKCGHEHHDHDHAHGDHDHAHEHEKRTSTESDTHFRPEVPREKAGLSGISASSGIEQKAAAGAVGHDHSHDHSHEHGHDHSHGHDHGHDHSHGLAPWRFALLLLPVVLFILGLPAVGGMNTSNVKDMSGGVDDVRKAGEKGNNFTIGFGTLEIASRNPATRDAIAGTTVQLKGQYKGDNPERFTLVRYKINCCAADAIPLKAVIMVDPEKSGKFRVDPAKYNGKWVQVTGQLQFSTRGKNEIVPVILLESEEMVKEIPPDNNPYVNDQ
jgi:hypothetical protein